MGTDEMTRPFKGPPEKVLAVGEQKAMLNLCFPAFETSIDAGMLVAIGPLCPSPMSDEYTVELRYRAPKDPDVRVLSPQLRRWNDESIPHMYEQERLCLHRPSRSEWTPSDLLSSTIVPWTELWLYFYEIWLISGTWHGGGEHPEETTQARKPS